LHEVCIKFFPQIDYPPAGINGSK